MKRIDALKIIIAYWVTYRDDTERTIEPKDLYDLIEAGGAKEFHSACLVFFGKAYHEEEEITSFIEKSGSLLTAVRDNIIAIILGKTDMLTVLTDQVMEELP